jgi:hypothetical protein
VILGMDQDTFVLESGNPNFEIAQDITNVAQQSRGYKAWIDGIKIGISLLMICYRIIFST